MNKTHPNEPTLEALKDIRRTLYTAPRRYPDKIAKRFVVSAAKVKAERKGKA